MRRTGAARPVYLHADCYEQARTLDLHYDDDSPMPLFLSYTEKRDGTDRKYTLFSVETGTRRVFAPDQVPKTVPREDD